MEETDRLPAGDYNIAQEIEGLKVAIKSGETGSLTLLRLAVLVENLLDRVGRLEQQRIPDAGNPAHPSTLAP